MALAVEKETRKQYGCKLWFTYRAGRITASRMKAACHTDPNNPSKSLIKAICYPEAYRFVSSATAWGCSHEKSARDMYIETMKDRHSSFAVTESGLVLNCQWPYLGASPDGVVSCDCCGRGVLEIKCPFCHHADTITVAATDDKRFCLKLGEDGTLHLDRSHQYYFQVQSQIWLSNVSYCDFCVCTFPGSSEASLHVERILPDQTFWDTCVSHSTNFFQKCILPELVGRWFSKSAF